MQPSSQIETSRIADQLRRAFYGEAWHGPALLEILRGVSAAEAAARPLPKAHRIWEIVRHVAVWDEAARRRMAGEVVQPAPHEDWPGVTERGSPARSPLTTPCTTCSTASCNTSSTTPARSRS